uniref:Uncharacterized protein n=1 Tax=Anopheles coluzzii TaxID=1518534 RepID=A0A8W7PQF3_ANOCL
MDRVRLGRPPAKVSSSGGWRTGRLMALTVLFVLGTICIGQSVISIGMGACWWHEVARAHTPRVLTYRSQQELQCLVSYTGLRCVIVTSEAPNAPPNASRNGKLKLLFRCSSRSSTTACSIL